MHNDQRELWFNGANFVDKQGKLRFGTGLRTGFGGEDAPHGFGAKATRAGNYSVDQSFDRAGEGYELQHEYRRAVREKGVTEVGRQTNRLRNAKGSAVTADFDPLYTFETHARAGEAEQGREAQDMARRPAEVAMGTTGEGNRAHRVRPVGGAGAVGQLGR